MDHRGRSESVPLENSLRSSHGESLRCSCAATEEDIVLSGYAFRPPVRCRPDLLLEWTPLLCPELVERCLERPLVSGLYRLITLVFRVTARAKYFDISPSPGEGNPLVDSERRTGFASGPKPLAEALGAGDDISEVGKAGKRTAQTVTGREQPGRGIEGGSDEGMRGVEKIEGGSDGGVAICRRVLRR